MADRSDEHSLPDRHPRGRALSALSRSLGVRRGRPPPTRWTHPRPQEGSSPLVDRTSAWACLVCRALRGSRLPGTVRHGACLRDPRRSRPRGRQVDLLVQHVGTSLDPRQRRSPRVEAPVHAIGTRHVRIGEGLRDGVRLCGLLETPSGPTASRLCSSLRPPDQPRKVQRQVALALGSAGEPAGGGDVGAHAGHVLVEEDC